MRLSEVYNLVRPESRYADWRRFPLYGGLRFLLALLLRETLLQ